MTSSKDDEQLTSNSRDEQTLMTWQYWRAGVDEQRRLRSVLQQYWWEWWADDQQYWPTVEQFEETDDVDVTVSFNCKSKLVLLLRLGYLSHFLAGPKRTRQGPGLRAGALFISRCWFRLTVVAGHNNTNDYKITLCCVCCVSDDLSAFDLWMMIWKMFMNCLW